jgi:hypothetical protein
MQCKHKTLPCYCTDLLQISVRQHDYWYALPLQPFYVRNAALLKYYSDSVKKWASQMPRRQHRWNQRTPCNDIPPSARPKAPPNLPARSQTEWESSGMCVGVTYHYYIHYIIFAAITPLPHYYYYAAIIITSLLHSSYYAIYERDMVIYYIIYITYTYT